MLSLVARYKGRALRFPVPEREAVLGASPRSHLIVPFPGVSRSHARVTRCDGGIRITDLSSKNGLWLGSERLDECVLRPGETARLGSTIVSLEEGATSDFELGLELPSLANEDDDGEDTDSHREPAPVRSAATALRFVQRHEKGGGRVHSQDRKGFLEEGAGLLGAAGIVILEDSGKKGDCLSDYGGVLPSADFLEEASRFAAGEITPIPGKLRRVGGFPCLLACGDENVVAAVFPQGQAYLEPWQCDFFEYLGDRLLDEEKRSGMRSKRAVREEKPVSREDPLVFPTGMVVGTSRALHELLDQMRATVRSRMDVLLMGETGTGKELFARMVHDSGPMSAGPFVAINCAAIPNDLLEAELFGVQARVATGVDPRMGLFQQANGGTIFLDEIGELAESLQAKLLRVLQEREVLPLGASAPKKVDVQVVSASNRNLQEMVKAGQFRADLYYRLRGLQFHIPPLRERPEDLPGLVLAFTEKYAALYQKRIRGVSRKAVEILCAHEWPGNIRELQNEVERAVLVCPAGGALQSEHFRPVVWLVEKELKDRERRSEDSGPILTIASNQSSPDLQAVSELLGGAGAPAHNQAAFSLQVRIEALEREAIEQALKEAGGNKSRAARILGITRNGLAMKLARLFGRRTGIEAVD